MSKKVRDLPVGTPVRVTSVNEPAFDGVVTKAPYKDGFGRWNVVVQMVREHEGYACQRSGACIYDVNDVKKRV